MTAAEERLRWLVGVLQDPDSVTVDDLVGVYDMTGWRDWSEERELEFLRDGRHASSRPLEVERSFSDGPDEATVILAGADEKRWSITVWVEREAPHRIVRGRLVPAPPDGLAIRLATEDDGPLLAELERRAPIRLGGAEGSPLTLMTFDHGEDYFAPSRLMQEVTIYVGEVDGEIAGVYCGAVQPVEIDGEAKRLFLEHHVRIDPATQRGAVFWALCNFGRDTYARATDSIAFYVARENHAVRKFVSGTPSWSVAPLRALIPCSGDAGSEGDADMARAVQILNACHGGSALFVPYTAASFDERLSRDPAQYGSEHVAVLGGAVVGVGRDVVRVTKECDGVVDESVRAVALDHGFEPGCEDDYRTLLLSTAARLGSTAGATHLAVFTSERSSTFGVVSELAAEIEPFDFWAFELPEPAAVAAKGLYVDPIYF